MRFQPPEEEERIAHIDMTPMIDVVFLLVIFFLVSAQLSIGGREDITLPEASEARVSERVAPDSIVIDVKALPGGTVWSIGGKGYAYHELMHQLRIAAELAKVKERPVPPIILNADVDVPYREIQLLMFDSAKLGYHVFDFRATPEEVRS